VDSLSKLLARQGRFLERESMVTFLVTELQEVFPEGSWAEQVSVSEKDNNSYSLEIISMSSSTGDISTLLERLGKVAGVSDVRMLYSEQSGSSRREQKSTRLKVACVWSQQ
jgi:Tfp pilus assembly protein PilN